METLWQSYVHQRNFRTSPVEFPDPTLLLLLQRFNETWATGSITHGWREVWVVPVLKPGKPQHNPASYRSISLTSRIAKLTERMAYARLNWFLESRGPLPESMLGFCGKLCAMNSILDHTSDIEHNNALQNNTSAVLLDITRVYENVQPGIVIRRLTEMEITGCAQLFIR